MPNSFDDTQALRSIAEHLIALELSDEQRASVLDGCRSALEDHERRLRAALAYEDTGLGSAFGASILPLRDAERRHLLAALRRTSGRIYGREGAAKLLELKPTTLQSKLKKHGIHRLDGVDGSASASMSASVNASQSEVARGIEREDDAVVQHRPRMPTRDASSALPAAQPVA